jgi:uncharacterized membrane protein YhiD involved in acid resistance
MINRKTGVVSVAFFAAILIAVFLHHAYGSGAGLARDADNSNTPAKTAQASPSNDQNPFAVAANQPDNSVAGEAKTWAEDALSVFGRLLLAVILSAVLAFRPRQNVPLFRRSLFVSQTQILLSVVAAALMMIVGDNTARAFAIFAAVSLVRFRTNIRDPKEITVLLISLALGLSAGVGRWELGIALCVFALALLWLLEYNEKEQVFRSMELTIKTRNPDHTQTMLKKLFRKYKLDAEVREIEPPDEKNEIGAIVYYLNLRLSLSTDYLSDRIMRFDSRNVEGIQWSQKKGATDIYQ